LAGFGFIGYFCANDVPVALAAAELDAAVDFPDDELDPPLLHAARAPTASVVTAKIAAKRLFTRLLVIVPLQ
jgi:hypothetical protein